MKSCLWSKIISWIMVGYNSVFIPAIIVGFILVVDTIYLIFVPNLTLVIKTNGGSSAICLKRKKLFDRNQTEDSGFTQIVPWADTDIAIKEIGTIIDDIQTMGDIAIGKWTSDNNNY